MQWAGLTARRGMSETPEHPWHFAHPETPNPPHPPLLAFVFPPFCRPGPFYCPGTPGSPQRAPVAFPRAGFVGSPGCCPGSLRAFWCSGSERARRQRGSAPPSWRRWHRRTWGYVARMKLVAGEEATVCIKPRVVAISSRSVTCTEGTGCTRTEALGSGPGYNCLQAARRRCVSAPKWSPFRVSRGLNELTHIELSAGGAPGGSCSPHSAGHPQNSAPSAPPPSPPPPSPLPPPPPQQQPASWCMSWHPVAHPSPAKPGSAAACAWVEGARDVGSGHGVFAGNGDLEVGVTQVLAGDGADSAGGQAALAPLALLTRPLPLVEPHTAVASDNRRARGNTKITHNGRSRAGGAGGQAALAPLALLPRPLPLHGNRLGRRARYNSGMRHNSSPR